MLSLWLQYVESMSALMMGLVLSFRCQFLFPLGPRREVVSTKGTG